MRIVVMLATALCLIASNASAGVLKISNDRGGQIGKYLKKFEALSKKNEKVIVDGDCLSACTLVLGMIPRNRIYATARARFGFHAAWMPDEHGRPVTSSLGTAALEAVYSHSPDIEQWIENNGGLTRHMIYLSGAELAQYVQPYQAVRTRVTKQAVSRSRLARVANARAH